MNNLKSSPLDNKLIDAVLCPCVTEHLRTCKANHPITLKDIYGLDLWLKLSPLDRRRFGFRFWSIRQSLGFKKTGNKRKDANLYIKIN